MDKAAGSSFLSIDLGVLGTRTFVSLDDFQQWREKERQFWKWLLDIRPRVPQLVVQIEKRLSQFYARVDQILNEARALQDDRQVKVKAKQIASYIQAQVTQQPIVLSESPEAQFITELCQEDPVVAAHTAGAMMGVPLEPSVRESVEGQFLSVAFRHSFRDRIKNERTALQHLQAEWRDILNQSKVEFEATSKQYDDFGAQYVQQMSSQKSALDEFRTAAENEFKSLVEHSQAQLTNIEKTYDEKLAVQAAVQYWKNKAQSHGSAATKLAWACAIVGVIVAVFLGAETFIAIGPLQKVSDLPLWKAAMLLLTAIIGVWSIRILVRLLLSNLHLKADAVERRTMLLTYLALLRRGQGPKEEQRELILQILFRPSSTGIIKDDALPPIVAQWLNSITS